MRALPFAPHAAPAIIVPLVGRSVEAVAEQAAAAGSEAGVDVLEWRVDALLAGQEAWGTGSSRAAQAVVEGFEAVSVPGLPVLATFRSELEGGECPAEVYFELVAAVMGVEAPGRDGGPVAPAAVDVEIARDGALDLIGAARELGVPVVASAHMWESTPPEEEIRAQLARMAAAGAAVAKIAVMPRTMDDVFSLMRAVHAAAEALPVPVIGIAMGELGRLTRLCGAEFGSAATFASVGEGSAPGQLSAAQVAAVRAALGG
ncbi:type I 3-dehydroquinate dehydratase [Brevibacterium album]|uniref:type I 3-dehydroquinate dehydratase n=1 Tax=Brevibacterium album TaxID=417948 RepID=UPI00042583D0|nr:type I 3-dehydroquinate dehydratase [Brevibacterium album]